MPTARHSRSAPACWGPSLAQGQLTWQRLCKVGMGSEPLAKDCSVRVERVFATERAGPSPLSEPYLPDSVRTSRAAAKHLKEASTAPAAMASAGSLVLTLRRKISSNS